MDAAGTAGPRPPRNFWRRLTAYGIDVAIAWIVVAVAFAALLGDRIGRELDDADTSFRFGLAVNSGEFRPPFYVGTRTCGKSAELLPLLEAYVAPAKVMAAEVCFDRSFGMPVGGTATLNLADTAEAGDLAGKKITVPLTIENHYRFVDVYALCFFVLLSVFSLRIFGTTPGKKALGLRVLSPGQVPALRREVTRNFPHLVVVLGLALLTEIARPHPSVPPTIQTLAIAIEVIALLSMLYLWVWPVLRWRGAFPHDRWFGLSVARVRALSPNQPQANG